MSKHARALHFTVYTVNGDKIPEAVIRKIEAAVDRVVKDSENPRLVVNIDRG